MSSSPAHNQQLEEKREQTQCHAPIANDTKSQQQTTSTTFPERAIETTTVANTKQYLQHRRSQLQNKKQDKQQLQSPRTNGNRRMDSRNCSGDLDVSVNEEPLVLQSMTLKNRHEVGMDTTVEKIKPTDFIQDIVADVSGKGITATNERTMRAKLTMNKKRNASFSRSTGVLVVVVVGEVIVAGGVAVCQMYPLSPAADLIRNAAGRVEEGLSTLLVVLWNNVELNMKNLGQVVQVKWLTLLGSKRLAEAARAMEMQALQGISGLIEPREVATVCVRLIEALREQLRPVFLSVVVGLELSMEWIHLRFMELNGDGELFDQVQALLLTAFSFLAEALSQSGAVAASSLGKVFEWLGVESEMSDVNLPGEHFLAPLVTHQAAIQNIGKGLTAQQFRAVRDVKRFEKRRVTIASATNSIIEETRAVALESVLNVKMAAVELIEERTRQLAEQYSRAFEQALEDYERTSWQAEEEGGSRMLAEITSESQAQLDAAASLKRYLSVHVKAVDEKLVEDPVLHTEYPVSNEQSPVADMSDSDLDAEEESQILIEIADFTTVERKEAPALEYRLPEKASESERVDEEQTNLLTVEFTEVSVVGKSSSPKNAVDGDHVTEDQLKIVAKHTEIDIFNAAVEPTDRKEAIDEVEQTFATQVVVDFDNTLLEVELIQAEVSKLVGVQNLSADEAQPQQEGQEAQLEAPVDGTDMKLVEELTAVADKSLEEVEVKRPLADVRTRVAAPFGIVAEGYMEKQRMEMTQCIQEDCKDILRAGDAETGSQSEQPNAESVLKVQVDVDGAMMFTELRHTPEKVASVLMHDEVVVEMGIQKGPGGEADEAQRERTGHLEIEENADAAALADVDILASDRMVAAKEILELEHLEQILLQEEAERLRVDEELRVIAEEEKIWLQPDQVPVEVVISHEDAVSGHRRIDVTKRAEAVADFESGEDRQLSSPDTLLGLPRPTSMQIGLFSMAFFGLAALTAYFFVRHRKRGFVAHSPRRRRRWQRLADIDESEAEEVVLLSDDSSDEEDDTDTVVVKQYKTKDIGRMANVDAEAIDLVSSDGEEDVEKEEASANRKNAEKEEDTVKEEDLDTERSRLIATKRVQTTIYTADHSVTSNLDSSAVDGDTGSVSSMAPRQEAPDTSQRTRLRRRGIRT